MVTREELFRETEEKIEGTTEVLRSFFHDLGEAVYKDQSVLPVQMGVSLLEVVKKAENDMNTAFSSREDDKAFSVEFDETKNRKTWVDDEMEKLREEEKDIRLCIGALIYEQCSLGLLDRDRFSSVYADSDEEKKLSEKAEAKSLFSRLSSRSALSRMKRSDNSRYLDYSSLIDNEENAVSLSGGNAETLVKKLEAVKEKRALLFQEKEEKDIYLSQNIARRKALEKGGLESDDERVEDSLSAYNEALINYGNYLYDRGGSWIGETTPPEILDILQKIIEIQNEYRELNERKSRLQKEAKADDYKALIEEEKEKIKILLGEREKIDMQIEDIEKEISRLEGLVEKLVK
ncbi:MAG: hypothetical protein MSS69_01435 [Spirochaetales bacterium]|nr:hypothetical protein [Spirochaetales bacterium]